MRFGAIAVSCSVWAPLRGRTRLERICWFLARYDAPAADPCLKIDLETGQGSIAFPLDDMSGVPAMSNEDIRQIAERKFRIGYMQGTAAAIAALSHKLTPEELHALAIWQGDLLTEWVNREADGRRPRPTPPSLENGAPAPMLRPHRLEQD